MNTGETIALIKAFGNGGSGSLPPVTSADNGKVLAVQNGSWAADSNLFVITRSGSSTDKTTTEIKDAIDSGKSVVVANGTDLLMYCGQSTSEWYFASCPTGKNIRYGSIIKSSGTYSGGTFPKLIAVTSSDNGSELIVKSGAWAKQQKKFIVTLTPTSPDYSSTMDKTVAQINEAYEAGQEIWFKVMTSAGTYVEVPVSFLGKDTALDYPNFGAEIVDSRTNLMIVAETLDTSDGTKATYSTTVYALTPAS